MKIPTLSGVIRRRMLVNFRAESSVIPPLLPDPFRPKLHGGHAIVGICLIRLEQIRPTGLPRLLGMSSENAAHRIAVEWTVADSTVRQGVYIPRRDTNSLLTRAAGATLFPSDHHGAEFNVMDADGHVEFEMRSHDGITHIRVVADEADALPATSCFASPEEASDFFAHGDLGFSATRRGQRLDGVQLATQAWKTSPLAVREVHSSYFHDRERFPEGAIQFDHALIMRDIPHEWHAAEPMRIARSAA